jgi:hypothetical protein
MPHRLIPEEIAYLRAEAAELRMLARDDGP